MFKRIGWMFCTVAFLLSCREPMVHEAGVRHIWGETRRGQSPQLPAERCDSVFTSSPEGQRLKLLADRIASRNPETFSGNLEISKICVGVDPRMNVIDARSTPESLSVVFSQQLVSLARNDDELAAVLSHELAHLTLQHQGFGETPPRMNSDAQYLQLRGQSKAIQDKIVALALAKAHPSEIFALNEQFAKIIPLINKRIDEIYGEENAHANWLEQEADEVGAEFFVRAGFSTQSFLEILWSSHPSELADRPSCESMIQNVLDSGKQSPRPARSAKSHPTTCWRVFHLKVDEWTHAHGAEIDTLKLR